MKRCESGHFFDDQKHKSCPFCGEQNLGAEVMKTMGKKINPGSVRASASSDPPQHVEKWKEQDTLSELERPLPEDIDPDEAKTVGRFVDSLSFAPVVGWLVTLAGPGKGRDYRITMEKNFIGRSKKMDICISGDSSISRENHAVVSYNPKDHIFRLFPGEGRGLVFHNNEEVISPLVLKPRDIIELGKTKLLFVPLCDDQFQWEEDDK